jgi:hypothetical protein
LHDFLINNKGIGPRGKEVEPDELEVGDLIQLNFDGQSFEHSLVVSKIDNDIYVAAHTYNCLDRPLNDYWWEEIRYIHIS